MKELNPSKPLSHLLHRKELTTWTEAIKYVLALPYGRNSSKSDLSFVVKEGKGTCSTKHAFLKAIADENGIEHVDLVLCIYLMTERNTPCILPVLSEHQLDGIPEAHCYLRIEGNSVDVTTPNADLTRILPDKLEEELIQPHQIGEYKIKTHRRFIERWIESSEIDYSVETLWQIREKCIAQLSV